MLTKQFETLDISGDAGIRAFGRDLEELFVNAASGMYSLITAPNAVRESDTLEVTSENVTVEGLLVSWLNELIFHFDANGFIGKKIVVTELASGAGKEDGVTTFKVTAFLTGEIFHQERHGGGLLIKAATYHKLKIEKAGDLWVAEVVFDI